MPHQHIQQGVARVRRVVTARRRFSICSTLGQLVQGRFRTAGTRHSVSEWVGAIETQCSRDGNARESMLPVSRSRIGGETKGPLYHKRGSVCFAQGEGVYFDRVTRLVVRSDPNRFRFLRRGKPAGPGFQTC